MENRLTLDPIPPSERAGLVRYPVPLDGGIWAVLMLPAEITKADVARIERLLALLPLPASVRPWPVAEAEP
jgi:hypothetical protein